MPEDMARPRKHKKTKFHAKAQRTQRKTENRIHTEAQRGFAGSFQRSAFSGQLLDEGKRREKSLRGAKKRRISSTELTK
jgi:hypothetical protein